jgi:hypothetical protein
MQIEKGIDKSRPHDDLKERGGYVSSEWNQFIYVIYETKRIKSEKQWRQLLHQSGVGLNTEIILTSGEEPTKPLESQRRIPDSGYAHPAMNQL